MVGWTTRAGLSSPLPHQTSDRRFSSHSERSHGPSSTDHGGGKRRLVISRKSGAESELVRAYTCVVELDAFNALSPPVRQPRRWFRLAPRTSLGEQARPPTATETCRRHCCAALQRFLSATPTAATLAAWRYSLQSAAPHRASAAWPLSRHQPLTVSASSEAPGNCDDRLLTWRILTLHDGSPGRLCRRYGLS